MDIQTKETNNSKTTYESDVGKIVIEKVDGTIMEVDFYLKSEEEGMVFLHTLERFQDFSTNDDVEVFLGKFSLMLREVRASLESKE